jgi:hypothetical protein
MVLAAIVVAAQSALIACTITLGYAQDQSAYVYCSTSPRAFAIVSTSVFLGDMSRLRQYEAAFEVFAVISGALPEEMKPVVCAGEPTPDAAEQSRKKFVRSVRESSHTYIQLKWDGKQARRPE